MSRVLLIEDDCLSAMRSIPDGSINMVLCDLPYGTTQNAWDSVIPLENLWSHYRRILTPKGVIALMSQGLFTARIILSQEDLFKYKITWVKSKPTNFLNAKKQPLRKHEDICIFYSQQPNYYPQMSEGQPYDKGIRKNQLTGSYGDFRPAHIKSKGSRYPTDVVYFKTAEAEGRVWHSTQKPVELGRYLVRTFTTPGDMVLDNCFGSASFLVAAAMENRNAIGIEQNIDIRMFKNGVLNLIDVAQEKLDGIANISLLPRSSNDDAYRTIKHFLNITTKISTKKYAENIPLRQYVQQQPDDRPDSLIPVSAW